MALRAVWKGFLKFGAVTCAIKLINAASESEKIHFRILNRKDRLPVKSAYVDEVTGDLVGAEDQIKGYQLASGDYKQRPHPLAPAHRGMAHGFVEPAAWVVGNRQQHVEGAIDLVRDPFERGP